VPISETIRLNYSKVNLAIGLECPLDEKTHLKAKDLFDLKINYVIYSSSGNGKKNKDKTELTTHSCSKADFYNNDTVDFTNIHELECLNITDNSIQGIYTDEVFTYYEFSLLAKND